MEGTDKRFFDSFVQIIVFGDKQQRMAVFVSPSYTVGHKNDDEKGLSIF
jgi:hypothetical protein